MKEVGKILSKEVKSLMSNKELLGAILGVNVTSIALDGNKIEFVVANVTHYLNIHELMYLMKEWVTTKTYSVKTYLNGYRAMCYLVVNDKVVHKSTEDTEVEAVIKACEWIYKEL